MYRFILFYFVLYICIYVAPWSCEARHLVPLYVHTCSGMTIKLNLNLNLNLILFFLVHQLLSGDNSFLEREGGGGGGAPWLVRHSLCSQGGCWEINVALQLCFHLPLHGLGPLP